LILYLIDDIKSITDKLAERSDAENNVEAEDILGMFLARTEEEFKADENDYYLRLAQLLDPGVSYRVKSLDEINKLLDRAKTKITGEPSQPVYDEVNIWASDAVNRSVPTADAGIDIIWSKEIHGFKKAMRKVRRKITGYDREIT
jgi:hypothetical protein